MKLIKKFCSFCLSCLFINHINILGCDRVIGQYRNYKNNQFIYELIGSMCWSLLNWNIIHVDYDPLNFEMKCFHQNEIVITNTASSCHLFFFIFLWSEKGVGEVEGRGERSGLLHHHRYHHDHQGMWAKGCWIKHCHQGHFLWFYSLESWFGFLFTRIMIWISIH